MNPEGALMTLAGSGTATWGAKKIRVMHEKANLERTCNIGTLLSRIVAW